MRGAHGLVSALALAAGGLLVGACGDGGGSTTGASTSTTTASTAKSGGTAATNAGASGDSVGAPECDEVLRKATSCKDKPGMAAIIANRDQWKSGLSNATTKDATIVGCKTAMEAVKAVGCDGGGVGGVAPSGSGSAGAAPGPSAAAGATGDSVGAAECDEVLKLASSPECKDKPGMSAIAMNREGWKRGLEIAAARDATISGCKAAMEAIKAVGCSVGGTAGESAWDGKAPFTCTGNDDKVISGVTANIAKGPAISAAGNCKLTIRGSTITTDKGIDAGGNAQVTIDGGEIKASDTAIDAAGNAQITATGAKISGKVLTSGNAKVNGVPSTKK